MNFRMSKIQCYEPFFVFCLLKICVLFETISGFIRSGEVRVHSPTGFFSLRSGKVIEYQGKSWKLAMVRKRIALSYSRSGQRFHF